MDNVRCGLLPLELMVEHRELDMQHDEIFGYIEFLKAASLEPGGLTPEDLQVLSDRFTHHFADEQRLAKEAMIEFSEHAQEHAKNLRLFNKARDEMCAGKLDLRTFLRYLEYWFEHHINEYDKPLGARLAERSLGRSARTARSSFGMGGQGLSA